ncbi:hypothetical protein, partial [Bacillus paramobilis]|uniref:hypothetical protein n=1 Tax=Bacillus paramobilis TaxID=2817477 RepID=UPI0027E3C5CE
ESKDIFTLIINIFQFQVKISLQILEKRFTEHLLSHSTIEIQFISVQLHFYPALMGSKTPISKFSESKEVRWGSEKIPID